jgi:hypothetical protein
LNRPSTELAHQHGPRALIAGGSEGIGLAFAQQIASQKFLQGAHSMATVIERWHALVQSANPDGLEALLADNAVFHSPVVHTPQEGKAITQLYLSAAFLVLFNSNFRYVREIVGERDAMLEFETEIDGVKVNGIDIIRWNDSQQITDFKVMIRPLKAIMLIKDKMATMLEANT